MPDYNEDYKNSPYYQEYLNNISKTEQQQSFSFAEFVGTKLEKTITSKPFTEDDLKEIGNLLHNASKKQVVGVTVNNAGLAQIQALVPPKPEYLPNRPETFYKGEIPNLYSGISVFIVDNQVDDIKCWFDQDSLELYLQNKNKEKTDND